MKAQNEKLGTQNPNAPAADPPAPNDGNTTNVANPAPLTEPNLAQLTEQKENYVKPPPTPDQRLLQAKNYLSDEDCNLTRDFEAKHGRIYSLLRTLAEDKVPCNIKLYQQVKDMLRVHQSRMDKIKHPVPEPEFPLQAATFSQRLPSNHPAAIAEAKRVLRKEDRAPFTIDRKPWHAEFVRLFRSNDDTGKRLRAVERSGYLQTLKNPRCILADLEDNTYEQHALKRGCRRAAVEYALQMIGGNEEQHFEGGWLHRVVSLPQPPKARVEEPQMCLGASESERPAATDPFRWTKKNIKFQQDQYQLQLFANSERAAVRASGLKPFPHLPAEPIVFYKPTQKPSIIAYRRDRRLPRIVRVAFTMIAHIALDDLSKAGVNEKAADLSREARTLFRAIKNGLISINARLTRDVSTASQIDVIRRYKKAGGQLLQRGRSVNAPLSDVELGRLEALSPASLSEQDGETDDMLRRLGTELFDLIDKPKLGDQSVKSRDRESLISWREDTEGDPSTPRAKKSFLSLRELAEPLNETQYPTTVELARTLLTEKILAENHEDLRDHELRHSRLWSFSHGLPESSKNRNFFSIERWSKPRRYIPGTETATPGTSGKRKAATSPETTRSSKRPRNEGPAAPTRGEKRKATSEPEGTPPPKRDTSGVDYPSLAPDELGFKIISEESREQVPEAGSGELMPPDIKSFNFKKHGQVLQNAPDPVEKRLRGPPIFPFGETVTTSKVSNAKVSLSMNDSKRLLAHTISAKSRRLTIVGPSANSRALTLWRPRNGARGITGSATRTGGFSLPEINRLVSIDEIRASGK